ncbi:folate-binding protein YgfZ [Mangrovactinospora gilvigrisea]|uniref:Folate-binding protein YgfZ n=1 Tax=Mangrovactinospora gilvigrisea TaxID=1428644 RepID=A0A1J7C8E4_9ACTN|nr:folate-binding protein YgfZ [Mangrovactinospora gilvigrisea]OIV37800.1 folate-binding protein YgfZ [Mangrovactinospora gilvigrisea]
MAAAPSSPLLNTPGAVAGEGVDEPVAAHYGELFREQRRLASGRGHVDLSHREVLRVSGEDRLAWLHLLLTQHVEHLQPHRATEALVLSAQGHIEHHLTLVDDGAATWIHVEPGTAQALLGYLESMKFFYRVEAADLTAGHAVLHLPAGSILEPPRGTAAVLEHAWGRDLIVPRESLEAVSGAWAKDAADAPVGLLALEALRVEAHRPRLGFETDHRTIPHEVGWLATAVHLDKGCYRGQETVARVHNLGRPPRRLVFLHLDGSEVRLPAHGAPVRLAADGPEGRAIGFVTTSARHHELGPVALALVKRNTPEDAALIADAVPAAQEVIVPA